MDKSRIKKQGIVCYFELKNTKTCVTRYKVGQDVYLVPQQVRPKKSVKIFLRGGTGRFGINKYIIDKPRTKHIDWNHFITLIEVLHQTACFTVKNGVFNNALPLGRNGIDDLKPPEIIMHAKLS